jgi:hypothetical protein
MACLVMNLLNLTLNLSSYKFFKFKPTLFAPPIFCKVSKTSL